MNIGKVVKKIVSTVKNHAFDGYPLLLVQQLNIDFSPKGGEVLCIDFMGADMGEIVLMMKEGSSVQQMLGNKDAPADAAVVGIVDEVSYKDKIVFKKY
ncbi:MAG: EutN/CcmL family microcompartment protein [Candidatus Riflebacteria bacterium]|nr:EutN/CcmL family microcompartment protein [Candidatus Riflebacteria bacterium]